MPVVKLSSKGQLVIPKEFREKLGLRPGGRALLELFEDRAEIRPLPDLRKQLRGSLKDLPSLTRDTVEEHRREVERDEAAAS